jgi:metallophosphoesterase (TIGR00282 family)
MRILILGDVVGRCGREAIFQRLPNLKKKLSIDFVVLNVDNAVHGYGVNSEAAHQFFDAGADVLTGGNHVFDQKECASLLEKEKRLLRPANMPDSIPGSGVLETIANNGRKIATIHLLGRAHMSLIGENPFYFVDKILTKYRLGKDVNAIIVDFHAEATSEKNGLGHYLDGRVSVVIGTHTHIPTADERILERGTAFQTDVGMCGDYDSVIGMQKTTAVERFVKGYSYQRMSPTSGEATLCGTIVDVDDKTGLAMSINSIRIGGVLPQK